MIEENSKVPYIKGEVEIKLVNRETGEVLDYEKESNIVVQYGYKNLLRGISNKFDGVETPNAVDNMKMGTDYGDGETGTLYDPNSSGPSPENPMLPKIDFTDQDQEFNHNGVLTGEEINASTINYDQISVNYDQNLNYSVTFGAITNGDSLLNNFFDPNVIEFTFNSLALYTQSTDYPIIAYKRFPAKTVTRIVDVDISWTLYFDI